MSETAKAGLLAALKAERASAAAKGRQAEVEAAPIRYVAELPPWHPTMSGLRLVGLASNLAFIAHG
jgi:hypothetical protein